MERPKLTVTPEVTSGGRYFTAQSEVERIPSGCLLLDLVLGGGWASGRVSNVVGDKSSSKTGCATEAMVNFCWKYKDASPRYREVESAWDDEYAAGMGLPLDRVQFGRKGTGPESRDEEKVDTVEQWEDDLADYLKNLPKNTPGLYVLDSLDALGDKDELENEFGAASYGAKKPKLIGQLFRRHIRDMETKKCHLMIVSQLRDKLNVCFDYISKVWLTNGTSEKIGKIVNQKLEGPVLSYNPQTGMIESRKIVGWHDNGKSEDFLKIKVSGARTSLRQLLVTPNHKIFTPLGEVEAGTLKVGDEVLTCGEHRYSEDQHTLILGSLFGDGHLRWECEERGSLHFGHCLAQADYCRWKAEVLGCKATPPNSRGVVFATTTSSEDFQQYREFPAKKRNPRRVIPVKFIDGLTVKAVAVWYMDDGTFSGSHKKWGHGKCSISCKHLGEESIKALQEKFIQLGLGEPRWGKQGRLDWDGEQSEKFQKGIAAYVHPSMRYKLKEGRPDFSWQVEQGTVRKVQCVSKVTSVEKALQGVRKRHRYDITIEGTHTYIVDGVIVHNSFGEKQVRSGGRALDFYASQIIWLANAGKRKKTRKGIERVIGFDVRAQCKKNKVGMPFRECEFPFIFGYGMEDLESCLMFLKEAKSLDEVGNIDPTEKGIANYLTQVNVLEGQEFKQERKRIHQATRKIWREVEEAFLPARSKY